MKFMYTILLISMTCSILHAKDIIWNFDRSDTVKNSTDRVFYEKIIHNKSYNKWNICIDENKSVLNIYDKEVVLQYSRVENEIIFVDPKENKKFKASLHGNTLVLHGKNNLYFKQQKNNKTKKTND